MSILTPRIDNLERNYIINGNFDLWQRGTSFTGYTGNAIYHADRFNLTRGATINTLVNTIDQVSDVPTVVQSNFRSNFSYRVTTTTAATNLAASDTTMGPTYHVEGYDLENLVGKTVTLSFWVKSSIAGTYALTFGRQFTDSYVTTYTISLANTWEKKSIAVYIDPAVNWGSNLGLQSGRGLTILWTLGAATTRTVSSLNQWLVGQNVSNANTATNTFCNTLNATFQLSQVMLNESTSLTNFNRAGRTFGHELALCQRYYETGGHSAPDVGNASGVLGGLGFAQFKVVKRATPTVIAFGNGNPNQVRNDNNGATEGTLVYGVQDFGFQPRSTSGLNDNVQYSMSWTADAEL